MTPNQTAEQLMRKYYKIIFDIDVGLAVDKDLKRYNCAVNSALITVNEILSVIENGNPIESQFNYWKDVEYSLNQKLI